MNTIPTLISLNTRRRRKIGHTTTKTLKHYRTPGVRLRSSLCRSQVHKVSRWIPRLEKSLLIRPNAFIGIDPGRTSFTNLWL